MVPTLFQTRAVDRRAIHGYDRRSSSEASDLGEQNDPRPLHLLHDVKIERDTDQYTYEICPRIFHLGKGTIAEV